MFTQLSINDLRVVREMRLTLSAGGNLVCGANGAGKTTVLEALHLLTIGRSFRHRDTTPLIRRGASAVELFCGFQESTGVMHTVGFRRERGELRVRFDGRSNVRRSEIMRAVPIQFIGPDPQQLIEGKPEFRRQMLDSGLFHVEPGYLGVMQRYARALQQRNAALRQGDHSFVQWDPLLEQAGETIHRIRQAYVDTLIDAVHRRLRQWELDLGIVLRYRSGWRSGETLAENLRAHRQLDRRQGFTSVGPHRADLLIDTEAGRGGKILSRGQLKMLVAALVLAQADIHKQRTDCVPVLLFDDLPAELDVSNRDRLLASLREIYPQWIVTALDPTPLLSLPDLNMFHVEQGALIED